MKLSITHKTLFKTFLSLIIVYVFIDFLKIFIGGSKMTLFALDAIIFLILFAFLKTNNLIVPVRKIPIGFVLLLTSLMLLIVIQFLNPFYFDLITSIGGARAYLFPIVGILIGIHFAKNRLFSHKDIITIILVITYICIGFAIFQIITDTSRLTGIALSLLTPQEVGIHSHGTEEVRLISSFFASSKRFGRFLLVMYLLYIGTSHNQSKFKIYHTVIFFIGFLISGARESVILFVLINLFWITKKFSFRKILRWSLTVPFFVLIILATRNNSEITTRMDFLLPSSEKYLERIINFAPFLSVNPEYPYKFYGIGVGKYGQEAHLNPSVRAKTEGIEYKVFKKPSYSIQFEGIGDSGLAKIFIELGYLGLIIFISLLSGYAFIAIKRLLIKRPKDYLIPAFSLYVISWIILFLKSHPLISDVFLTFMLYFSIGYILHKTGNIKPVKDE